MKRPGSVYCIRNYVTRQVYVGSTMGRLCERLSTHRHSLRHGKHWITALQSDWASIGEWAFYFELLTTCYTPIHVTAIEQSYVDYYRHSRGGCYNLSLDAYSTKGMKPSLGTRAKMQAAWRGRVRSESQLAGILAANTAKRRPIGRVDRGTGLIDKTYPSVSSVAADGFNVSNVTTCLRGRLHTSGGYKWVYINPDVPAE